MNYRTKPGLPGDVLEHHGVKGMRWGDRNVDEPVGRDSGGQIQAKKPSVLSEKKQHKIEKFQKRSDVMNTKISELKASNEALKGTRNLRELNTKRINNQNIKFHEKDKKRAEQNAAAVQQGKLTSKQKKVIAGAVGVTAIVGVAVVMRGQQSGAFNSYALKGAAFLKGEKVPFDVSKDLAGHMSASDLLTKVAKPVNPGYSGPGGHMNCRRSTFAYELRRRGFDVHATTSSVGWGQSESGVINALTTDSKDFLSSMSMSSGVVSSGTSSVAKGDKRTNPVKKILLDNLMTKDPSLGTVGTASSSKRVLEELAKQPNGARGEVMFKFPGFGHSMAYEIVDGVPHIFDSQKGDLYHAAGKMVESKWDGFNGAEIMRLDNANLDLNFLTRWATNAGGK